MTMVYFLRHAESEPEGNCSDDSERMLTAHGEAQCHIVAKFINQQNISPSHFWLSPAKRTKQTADIIASELTHPPKCYLSNWLGLFEDSNTALMEVAKIANTHNNIFLISHEPNISFMITQFLGANAPALKIKKASLTALSLNKVIKKSAVLQWSIPIEMMS